MATSCLTTESLLNRCFSSMSSTLLQFGTVNLSGTSMCFDQIDVVEGGGDVIAIHQHVDV